MVQTLHKEMCGCGARLKCAQLLSSRRVCCILVVLVRYPNLAGLYPAHINMQIELEYRIK